MLWVHGIAVNGLTPAYDMDITFGPVMAWIWGVLAAIQPAFQTVTDASDPAIRALMKLPASLADLGLAALVVYALRGWPELGGRRSARRSSCTRPSSTSARGGASTSPSTCCPRWVPSSSRSTAGTGRRRRWSRSR